MGSIRLQRAIRKTTVSYQSLSTQSGCCVWPTSHLLHYLDLWTGWGIIDAILYSKAYMSRAKVQPHCHFCLSDTHASQECPYAPTDDTSPQPKVPRGHMTALRSHQPCLTSGSTVKLCSIFNKVEGTQCCYLFGCYSHICEKCNAGPHPATDCGKQQHRRLQKFKVARAWFWHWLYSWGAWLIAVFSVCFELTRKF